MTIRRRSVSQAKGGATMKRRIGDRRTKPRFEIIGDLWGSVDVSASLAVVNLGRGGALLESPVPFVPESVHAVVAVTHEESHKVTVRVRHSTGDDRQGQRRYLVGVEFIDMSPALEEFLARQVTLGNSSLSVEA
jgi:PilZ domain